MKETHETPGSEQLHLLVVEALEERKALDIVTLDVSRMTTITDHMIIASGTSDRHVKSVADNVVQALRKKGVRASGIEGAERGEWVLVDFGDVIVHVMLPRVREFYNLEKLWDIEGDVSVAMPDN